MFVEVTFAKQWRGHPQGRTVFLTELRAQQLTEEGYCRPTGNESEVDCGVTSDKPPVQHSSDVGRGETASRDVGSTVPESATEPDQECDEDSGAGDSEVNDPDEVATEATEVPSGEQPAVPKPRASRKRRQS